MKKTKHYPRLKFYSSPHANKTLFFHLKELSCSAVDDDDDQQERKNWRGILTALFVIAAMCSLIALAVLILSPPLLDADQPQQRISLQDVLTLRFLSFVESLEWMDSRRLLVKYSDVVKVLELRLDEQTGGEIVWEWKQLDGDLFRYGKPSSIAISPNTRYLILHYASNKRSTKGSTMYRIYDLQTQTFENVGPEKSGEENVPVLVWNPKGDDFAFVHANNVFYQSSALSEQSTQITNDSSSSSFPFSSFGGSGGGNRDLLNGVADWLYEEEILQSAQAMWWSLDGRYLAFLTIDNRKVPHVPIAHFAHHQYPSVSRQAYPKTGEQNLPQVWLSVWRKSDGALRKISVEDIPESSRAYLFSAHWIELQGQAVLAAVWTNRFQNQIFISLCTFDSQKCVPNFSQKFAFDNAYNGGGSPEDGGGSSPPQQQQQKQQQPFRLWAEPEDSRVRFHTTDAYFMLLPHRRPNGNVYTHLAKVTVPSSGMEKGRETFLSSGDFDVEKINCFDERLQKIYFTAAAPLPSQRHLYVSSTVVGGSSDITTPEPSTPICLSCNLSSNCTFHDTQFAAHPTSTSTNTENISSPSPSIKQNNNTNNNDVLLFPPQFVFLSCKGPGTPHVMVASLNEAGDKLERVFEFGRNAALEDALDTYRLPTVHYVRVRLKGRETLAKILVPYGLDLDEKRPERKYPVLIDVYAGPGTQKVTEEWLSTNMFDVFFSSALDYVVVFIDGRGSGHQGWRMKQPLYRNFGTVEVDDQIETMRELLRLYPVLDAKRVAIWGWSYGGFVSARAVQRDYFVNRTFHCAASVAPVSNFRFYDATYAERYMGESGAEAYEKTDLTVDVRPFHNVSYLLAHGSADDNVHYQNAAELVRALTDENVQFQLMVYTDDSHNLSTARWHLYTMLVDFFKRCFSQQQKDV